MLTLKRWRNRPMSSCTRISGAEAPAVIARRLTPMSHDQSSALARGRSCALGQPALRATSTSRRELDEVGAPMTRAAATRGGSSLTARWRVVGAGGGGVAVVFLGGADGGGKAPLEDAEDAGGLVDRQCGRGDVGEPRGLIEGGALRLVAALDQHPATRRQLAHGADHLRMAGM